MLNMPYALTVAISLLVLAPVVILVPFLIREALMADKRREGGE